MNVLNQLEIGFLSQALSQDLTDNRRPVCALLFRPLVKPQNKVLRHSGGRDGGSVWHKGFAYARNP